MDELNEKNYDAWLADDGAELRAITEEEYAASLASGDEKTLSEFTSHHLPRIASRIRKRFNLSEEDAEDIAQDTMIKIYGKLEKFKKSNKHEIGGYVHQTAQTTAIDHINKRRGASNECPEEAHDPTEDYEKRRLLEELIDSLEDERERRIVIARGEGLSWSEIAANDGISYDNARQIGSRAFNKIRSRALGMIRK